MELVEITSNNRKKNVEMVNFENRFRYNSCKNSKYKSK
jgi:hypothetical protein